MTIIAVANSKGGVGKSTTSVHLAAWLAELGYRVMLVDCDSQHSSSEWIREACPQVKSIQLDDPDDILDELEPIASKFDYIVADGPGSQSETLKALLMRADLAIVPCKASMLEARALAAATAVLRRARSVRSPSNLPEAVIVLSMVGRNYRLTKDMKEAATSLNLPLIETPIIHRQIYADAPGQATVVWNMGAKGKEAAKELSRVFAEILPDAKCQRKKSKREKSKSEAV